MKNIENPGRHFDDSAKLLAFLDQDLLAAFGQANLGEATLEARNNWSEGVQHQVVKKSADTRSTQK